MLDLIKSLSLYQMSMLVYQKPKMSTRHMTYGPLIKCTPAETRLGHTWHGAGQQGDWDAEETVWGHVPGAEGGHPGDRGGQMSTGLGLPRAGQNRGGEGEHQVRPLSPTSCYECQPEVWRSPFSASTGRCATTCVGSETGQSAISQTRCEIWMTWGSRRMILCESSKRWS